MSDQFPLKSDAFTGGSRLTAQQRSEGGDAAPLFELLNEAALGVSGDLSAAPGATAVDLSALTAEQLAPLNGGVTRVTGAAADITLPLIATAPEGWSHTFIAVDGTASTQTISPSGSDTVNAATSLDFSYDHQAIKVYRPATGTDWVVAA